MGFYLRKSIKAGPFRFNLSKSGIGVSTGVPGFRVGTGPRGNYVHMGRHGVYYRASLGSTGGRPGASWPVSSAAGTPPAPTRDVILQDVTGATTVELAASNASEFLQQINSAARRTPVARRVALVGGILTIFLLSANPVVGILGAAGTVGAAWWIHQRDQAHCTVVAFYDINDEAASRYQKLIDHFATVSAAQRVWHILAAGAVKTTYQYKTNAGASSVVRRTPATLSTSGPKVLVTNIAVPSIEAKQRGYYFLPDKILIRDGKTFADLSYGEVFVSEYQKRFIEDGLVPRDSRKVGTTWKYVNVKGGPDRRYKNNRQLPILEYGEVELKNRRGLHALFQLSRRDAAEHFAAALATMTAG